MTDRRADVAADIAALCGFADRNPPYLPLDHAQIRCIVAELEGTDPRAGKDKRELMLRIAGECGFAGDRYESTRNGPPPFQKEHLVSIRDTLNES